MNITWFGHAAFLIESGDQRIIMDPYQSPGCGYDPVDAAADIVTISHDNVKYHSCLEAVTGNPVVVDGMAFRGGTQTVHGIEFASTEVFEDDHGEGPNTMISFELEGLRITHMGDCGHALNETQKAAIANTDILLALTGGPPTILLSNLKSLIDEIQPAITIPMHFGTLKIDMNLQPLEDFLELFTPEQCRHAGAATATFTANELPTAPCVHVLEHLR